MTEDFAVASGRRMARQFLDRPAADATPAEVARRMVGVHAQVQSAAELGVALRLAGGTVTTVRESLRTERTLVKTFGPRGTLYLLAAADLATWVGALAALPSVAGGQPPGVAFTDDETAAVVAAVGAALATAELTLAELDEAVADLAGPWAVEPTMPAFGGAWPRWRQSLTDAARAGVLCVAADRGRQVVYTSPRRWLPGFAPAPAEPALRRVLLAYLAAYGPVTPAQLGRWLAVGTTRAARLLSDLAGAVETVTFAGATAYVVAGDRDLGAVPADGVRLLPYFDQYAVAGAPRHLLYPGPVAARALSRTGQAGNRPVVLVDGVVAGIWHLARRGRRATVTVETPAPLDRPRTVALAEQADRVGAATGLEVGLVLGPVPVGPHA